VIEKFEYREISLEKRMLFLHPQYDPKKETVGLWGPLMGTVSVTHASEKRIPWVNDASLKDFETNRKPMPENFRKNLGMCPVFFKIPF